MYPYWTWHVPVRDARTVLETETALKRGIKGTMHMRHVHESEPKPKGNFAKRIVAAVAAVAMLGGMGYATTSAALADDVNATVEQQNGISIGLHDYNRSSINNNHALHFMSGRNETGYNRYVQDGKGAYAGIVKPLLTNDYPTMADGNGSLDYLFGGASDNTVVTNHTPEGGLLTSDGQGNYSFDAASKYAKYDHNSNRFELTNQTQSGNRDPLFTPFGNDSDDNRYSFGMNLGADFYMPKDGKVNNQNMVFDFTGDDDVWVFIDDVLVLDLGGIHQALGGSIDFAADKIKYDKVQSHGDTPAATITEAFRKAGKKWDSKAYATHHLSFFYLERGDGGSNCKISFNLPVKPSKAIDIEKQTLGTIPAGQQFQFQLFANGSQTPYEGKYSVYNASTNQVVSSGFTGSNGVITLAKGQFARVQSNDFSDDTTYSVRELNSGKYTVSANGEALSQHNDGNGGSYAETHSFKVSDTSHVTVINSNVKPQNNKTIEKVVDGDGDQYELHLNASGDSASSETTIATPADIVLVMDKSGSMQDENDNRDTNAKNAANKLAEKLLTKANSELSESQQVQMAVVTFSDKASTKQSFTTSVDKIKTAVSSKPNGGTNWEAALKKANSLQGRTGVRKHIIFLSDGNPTFRTTSYSGCYSDDYWGRWIAHPEYTTRASCQAQRYMWGENPDGGSDGAYGAGDSDEYGFNYAAALAEANNRGDDAALYVVKASTDANRMSDFAREAKAVNGEEFNGTNAENLTQAFGQIYSSITSSAKIKVSSITDTLSQWVDPVDFAGVADGADITQYVTVKNGNKALTGGYTATYGVDQSGNRTVTVTFNGTDGIVTEKADSIDVSFKVKPSDAAYATYAGNQQYPNVGEPNTGTASAGQPGFYSNVDARLNYCVLTEVNGTTSCAPTEVEYPHPVVQVKLGKIKIVKQWSDGASKHDDGSVTVQLQRKKSGDSNAQLENVGGVITLNKGNDWQTTVANLVPGYTYSVAEISGDDRYDVSYMGNNVDLTKQMVWSSNADAGTLNATITNTLKTVALENAISVKKDLAGREWKTSDTFDFTLAAKGNAPLPDKCEADQPCTVKVNSDSGSHTASFGNITYNAGDASYTYYVTEVKGSIASLHYSQAKYEVVVTVAKDSNGEWKASVKSVTKVLDDNGAAVPESQSAATEPVTFTNRYVAVSALPLTGGATGRQWLLVGGVIGGLAVLLIGAAEIWNNKKRLV